GFMEGEQRYGLEMANGSILDCAFNIRGDLNSGALPRVTRQLRHPTTFPVCGSGVFRITSPIQASSRGAGGRATGRSWGRPGSSHPSTASPAGGTTGPASSRAGVGAGSSTTTGCDTPLYQLNARLYFL